MTHGAGAGVESVVKAMRDYKSGARIGYGNAAMPAVVAALGDADLQDLAHYLAHLSAPAR